jgi:hypothetical protein
MSSLVGGTPAMANSYEVIGLAVLLIRATFHKKYKHQNHANLQETKTAKWITSNQNV